MPKIRKRKTLADKMPRKPLTDEQRAETRTRAIEGAMALIERGEKPTIRKVASEIAISAMSLYTYFEGSEEMFNILANKIHEGQYMSHAYLEWCFANVPIGHPAAQRLIQEGRAIK